MEPPTRIQYKPVWAEEPPAARPASENHARLCGGETQCLREATWAGGTGLGRARGACLPAGGPGSSLVLTKTPARPRRCHEGESVSGRGVRAAAARSGSTWAGSSRDAGPSSAWRPGPREARRIPAESQTAEGRLGRVRPVLRVQPALGCSGPKVLPAARPLLWQQTAGAGGGDRPVVGSHPVAASPRVARRSEPTQPQAAERLTRPACPSHSCPRRRDRGGHSGGHGGGHGGAAAPGALSQPASVMSIRPTLTPL